MILTDTFTISAHIGIAATTTLGAHRFCTLGGVAFGTLFAGCFDAGRNPISRTAQLGFGASGKVRVGWVTFSAPLANAERSSRMFRFYAVTILIALETREVLIDDAIAVVIDRIPLIAHLFDSIPDDRITEKTITRGIALPATFTAAATGSEGAAAFQKWCAAIAFAIALVDHPVAIVVLPITDF